MLPDLSEENQYRSLLESMQQQYCPELVSHLSGQKRPKEKGGKQKLLSFGTILGRLCGSYQLLEFSDATLKTFTTLH